MAEMIQSDTLYRKPVDIDVIDVKVNKKGTGREVRQSMFTWTVGQRCNERLSCRAEVASKTSGTAGSRQKFKLQATAHDTSRGTLAAQWTAALYLPLRTPFLRSTYLSNSPDISISNASMTLAFVDCSYQPQHIALAIKLMILRNGHKYKLSRHPGCT